LRNDPRRLRAKGVWVSKNNQGAAKDVPDSEEGATRQNILEANGGDKIGNIPFRKVKVKKKQGEKISDGGHTT